MPTRPSAIWKWIRKEATFAVLVAIYLSFFIFIRVYFTSFLFNVSLAIRYQFTHWKDLPCQPVVILHCCDLCVAWCSYSSRINLFQFGPCKWCSSNPGTYLLLLVVICFRHLLWTWLVWQLLALCVRWPRSNKLNRKGTGYFVSDPIVLKLNHIIRWEGCHILLVFPSAISWSMSIFGMNNGQ